MAFWSTAILVTSISVCACASNDTVVTGSGGTAGAGTGATNGGGSGGSDAGAAGGAGGSSGTGGSGSSDAPECYPPALDAGSGCQGLDEASCKKHPVPCLPLYGKHIQSGQLGYAGCVTAMECVDGKWAGLAPGAAQSCGQDPAKPDECWLFNEVWAPDGWTVVFECTTPACLGAFTDAATD